MTAYHEEDRLKQWSKHCSYVSVKRVRQGSQLSGHNWGAMRTSRIKSSETVLDALQLGGFEARVRLLKDQDTAICKGLRVKSSNCTQLLCLNPRYRMFGLVLTKCNLLFPRNHCNTSQCSMLLTTANQHVRCTPHPYQKSLLLELCFTKQSDNTVHSTL